MGLFDRYGDSAWEEADAFWAPLLEKLVVVVRKHGPLDIGDVSKIFQAVHGTQLNLRGHKLRDCLEEEGRLKGPLFISGRTGMLEFRNPRGGASRVPPLSCPDEPLASYHLVDSVESCTRALTAVSSSSSDDDGIDYWDTERLSLKRVCEGRAISVELEGSGLGTEEGNISLVKIGGTWSTQEAIIFDVTVLERTEVGKALLREQLCPFFQNECYTKRAGYPRRHDGHRQARALSRAARSATSLAKAGEAIMATGLNAGQTKQVLLASKLKVDNAMATLDGTCRMAFRDHGSCSGGGVGRVMISHELLEAKDKDVAFISGKNMESPDLLCPLLSDMRIGSITAQTNPVEEDAAAGDVNSPLEVLKLIPDVFLEEHLSARETQNLQDLQDIMLDDGRRPKALLHGRGNIFLCSDKNVVVTAQNIDRVVGELEQDGKFGDDNRAGFPDQLHRVSVLRRKHEKKIIGVTLRIGRFFKGSAGLIDDLLFPVEAPPGKAQRAPSILVLGVPGSGKTTAIRDICRKISATQTVMIVDTSNEIAGDGDTPHRDAIGESRRIMVPNKKDQHRAAHLYGNTATGRIDLLIGPASGVMTEALQNHTPRTIVVDEISDDKEACACLDIKERGVRVVASAHGDFQSILKNPKLNTLVGGKTAVTVGDGLAIANGGNKVQTQRAGAPIFDTIIELKRGDVNEWSIIRDVGAAVDALLSGKAYEVERRRRLTQEDSNSEDVTFRLAYDTEVKRTQ